jgi:hypothetical protein
MTLWRGTFYYAANDWIRRKREEIYQDSIGKLED